MKLSRAANYALHAAAYLAAQRSDEPLASHTIAEARGIPARFLLKVLQHLVEAGLLHSVKGPRGGYQLARLASEITLLEILEAVEGPIEGETPPLYKEDDTPLTPRLDDICREAAEQAAKVFARVRLSQLVTKLRISTNGHATGRNGSIPADSQAGQ